MVIDSMSHMLTIQLQLYIEPIIPLNKSATNQNTEYLVYYKPNIIIIFKKDTDLACPSIIFHNDKSYQCSVFKVININNQKKQ